VSCWVFPGHSCFFAEARRKDENERPQAIQRQQISKMASPTTSPTRSARRVPGGQPVSRNWVDRPACSSTWFGSGASLWSNRLPPKAVWRPDARVQHVNLQFGKQSGMHLRFASAARERLVMKRTTLLAFFLSHGGGRETFGLCIAAQRNVEPGWVMPAGYIEPRKIVFHRRRVPHQTCGMNWPQELPEDSQILPRKPSSPSAISKNSLQPQQ
jgi:hypothetical protein